MKRFFDERIAVVGLLALAVWLFVVLPLYHRPPPSAVATSVEDCVRTVFGVCIITPPDSDGGIFGFAEFVQAFALLVLIFTVSGTREQFRIDTAPIRLWHLTYWSSGAIGAFALLSDLWFAQHYPMPWFLASQAYWQSTLGLLFLSLALTWLWFVYLRPPKFSRANAYRFTAAVYHHVMQGVDRDVAIVADELRRSSESIITMASAAFEPRHLQHRAAEGEPRAEDYACDLLLMLGNRRFCRHIAGNSPNTAIALFRAVSERRQYNVPLSQFASALATEAIVNKDSILYHEDAGYYSGYFGYARPFTNTIFGDFDFVETLASNGRSPLDVDLDVRWRFDEKQLEAYARATLTTFSAALKKGNFRHSYAIQRAFDIIKDGCADLYKLNDPLDPHEKNDIHARLRAAVEFVNDAIRALDKADKAGLQRPLLRRHGQPHTWQYEHWQDKVAQMIVDIIGHASWVKTKEFESWTVHHNLVWGRVFGFDQSKTRKIVLFKVRRLLYEEIKDIENAPNFANAAYLGLLLNVFGLQVGNRKDYRREEYPLRKVVIAFARKNYLALVARYPKVADAVLIGSVSFDQEKKQLVKTYQAGLNLVAPTVTLDLLTPD